MHVCGSPHEEAHVEGCLSHCSSDRPILPLIGQFILLPILSLVGIFCVQAAVLTCIGSIISLRLAQFLEATTPCVRHVTGTGSGLLGGIPRVVVQISALTLKGPL